ncbi:hypothetical protein LX16_3595 [Stackebrandtia albiflava]|uniref:mRNA interferase MazF n=2 Tax=Stackebrandtia albiflava TaxID=406432 RepID=A0A562V4L2_9ACTN|nr:hypothetical protein LX16_3595 [Stackebrandtia albiflava]
MAVKRGELVQVGPDVVLVVSGGMFNQLPDEPGMVAVPITDNASGPLTVKLGEHGYAVPGWVTSIPKSAVTGSVGRATIGELTEVNNMLFKILGTD